MTITINGTVYGVSSILVGQPYVNTAAGLNDYCLYTAHNVTFYSGVTYTGGNVIGQATYGVTFTNLGTQIGTETVTIAHVPPNTVAKVGTDNAARFLSDLQNLIYYLANQALIPQITTG